MDFRKIVQNYVILFFNLKKKSILFLNKITLIFSILYNSGSGSEHTIDGKSGDAEIHFVHWNSKKYKSIEEAVQNGDGLAVLGAIIKEDDKKSNKNQANQIIKQFPTDWKMGEKNPLQGTEKSVSKTSFDLTPFFQE